MSKATGKTGRVPPKDASSPAGQPLRMADVARLAGVHQTTVSLALRNHPSIPEETRRRIREVADKAGYRPDPLLDAFNFHRLAVHPVSHPPTIAYVVDARHTAPHLRQTHHPLVFQGAREEAASHRINLELFVVGPSGLSPSRLNKILVSRGITALILTSFNDRPCELELDWDRFCAVKVEARHVKPDLDIISADQWLAARVAHERLRQLGYRRLGLVLSRHDELRVGESYLTAFLVAQSQVPDADHLPPFEFQGDELSTRQKELVAWVRQNQVEAVLSNWNQLGERLAEGGLPAAEMPAIASFDAPLEDPRAAGVIQNHALAGCRAVEQVRSLLQGHQRGIPATQSITFVPGYWRDAESAPDRALRQDLARIPQVP